MDNCHVFLVVDTIVACRVRLVRGNKKRQMESQQTCQKIPSYSYQSQNPHRQHQQINRVVRVDGQMPVRRYVRGVFALPNQFF